MEAESPACKDIIGKSFSHNFENTIRFKNENFDLKDRDSWLL